MKTLNIVRNHKGIALSAALILGITVVGCGGEEPTNEEILSTQQAQKTPVTPVMYVAVSPPPTLQPPTSASNNNVGLNNNNNVIPVAPKPAPSKCVFQMTPNNSQKPCGPPCKPGTACKIVQCACVMFPMPGYNAVVWADCDMTCDYNPWALPVGQTAQCYNYNLQHYFHCDNTGCCTK